jgi:hypothetical protein
MRIAMIAAGILPVTALFTLGSGSVTPVAAQQNSWSLPTKGIPGCRDTLIPRIEDRAKGPRCLEWATPSERSIPSGVVVRVFGNGPYGSQAWHDGWNEILWGPGYHVLRGRPRQQCKLV